MAEARILWVDDEIDLLQPHILFLEKKGYDIITCNNGNDALEAIDNNAVDIVFLDENMPGLSGLETLKLIKGKQPHMPIVMITKSEEEHIMEEAIGSMISDYLIKPVNPHQILLSLKKNLDTKRLVSEQTTSDYQQQFRNISMDLMNVRTYDEWAELYKRLISWELKLENIQDSSMLEILEAQKVEANSLFFKFFKQNYGDWLYDEDKPVMSHTLFKEWILPELKQHDSTMLIVIDNLRWDQWKILQPIIEDYYRVDDERHFYSILPSATQFARNALFSGLMPSEMEKRHPDLWRNEADEGGKNMFEARFLEEQLKRLGMPIKHSYHKISSLTGGKKFVENFSNYKDQQLIAVVYNFVDMLSHAKTEMEVIRELASDDKAYRSLTLTWFENSPLLEIIKLASEAGMNLLLTTDHGTINVKEPTKIVGDRNTSSNLRYKQGKSLSYKGKDVMVMKNPKEYFLPIPNVSTSYVFAKENLFFAYPNNYNHYVKYYRNTYQHGGISMEENIIPFVKLTAKTK